MRDSNITRGEHRSPSPGPGADNHRVAGVFGRPDDVAKAVENLAAASIPADEVDVFAVDDEGQQTRRLVVRDEPGTLKGAIVGAISGGALGLVAMILAMTDVFGGLLAGPFSDANFLDLLRVVGASAAMGVPIGAVIGMGHWQGRKKMVTRDFGQGAVMVVVESNEMSDIARRVLRESGADQVTG